MSHSTSTNLGLATLRRHYTDPHRLYDALRRENGMAFDPLSHCWLVTGHRAILQTLSDDRFTSNLGLPGGSQPRAGISSLIHSAVGRQMIFMDGEVHERAQRILLRPLAHMVKTISPRLRAFVGDILAAAHRHGELDIVRDFASPLSLQVIAVLLGIPTDDAGQLRLLERWSDTFGDVTSGYMHGDLDDISRLVEYFRQLIAAKKRHPADDLVSILAAAQDIFPEEEDLIANCLMVFGAGRVTTKKLLGNGVPLLMPRWTEWQRAVRDHAGLVKPLGEELLRLVTPTRYVVRQAREDISLSDQFPGHAPIRQGEKIFLFLEAANRDPAVFAHPDQIDPARGVNKHLAFGAGPHRCPGAGLARLEIQIALETLLSNADLRPSPGTSPIWNPNPNLGGYNSYPVRIA